MLPGDSQLRWFHGAASREAASRSVWQYSQRLPSKDGSFLVRHCRSVPGDYVLSMIGSGQVLHFQVHCHYDNRFSIDNGPLFQGLDSLIDHYKTVADGLPCRLTSFCPGSIPPLSALKFGIDTPLHLACREKDLPQVMRCLQDSQGQREINGRDSHGLTPLHVASSLGFDDAVKLLLKYGANVKAVDSHDMTSLQMACVGGHASTLEILIVQGNADVQERYPAYGWVPLHEAASRGHLTCIRVLLAFHASMNPRASDGDTPRDLALRYGQYEVADFLDNFPVPPPKLGLQAFLHENLDRSGAVALLTRNGLEDGMFLVRTSIKCHGYYVLTIALSGKCFNFQIKSRADRWFYIDDGPLFETLPHLIDHYMTHADGLPVLLRTPISPEKPELPKPRIPSLKVAPRNAKQAPMPSRPHASSASEVRGIDRKISLDGESEDYFQFSDWNHGEPPLTSPVTPPVPSASPAAVTDEAGNKSQQTIITRESLETGAELGVGEFGSVLKGVWMNPQGERIPVAMKTLHQDKLQQGEKEFLREARVMSQLNHPCIVRLLGVCLGPPMILVQELVSMGALLDYLIDFQAEVRLTDLKLWAGQIAWGMMYLEQKRFVHRDLATRNILLKSKEQLKISDFGLSRAVGSGSDYYQASQGGRWPVKWYAPESINYGTFSHKSDVWSYGVTLWEMFTFGELPYGELTGAEVIALLEQGQRLERPEVCPDGIYSIMLKCWDIEPQRRPSFQELHQIFATDPEYEDSRPYRQMRKQ